MRIKLITGLIIATTSLSYGSFVGLKKIETNKISKETQEKLTYLNHLNQQLDSYYVSNDNILVIKYDKIDEINQVITQINLVNSDIKKVVNKQDLVLKKANNLIEKCEATTALAESFEYETIINYNLSEATLNPTVTKEDLKKIEEKFDSLTNEKQATNWDALIADSENIITYRNNYQKELQDALNNSNDTNYLDEILNNYKENIKLVDSPRIENKIKKQIEKIKIKAENIKKEKEEEQRLAVLKQQELDRIEAENKSNSNFDNTQPDRKVESVETVETVETALSETSSPENIESTPAPAPRTDGINFNGYHFDITWFSGSGGSHVATWTPYIYRWSELPNLYLAEKQSDVGNAVWSLQIGSQLVLDGATYTVYKYSSGVNNQTGDSYNLTVSEGAPITIVTCETNSEWSLQSMWFAR